MQQPSTENKEWWCKHGAAQEARFVFDIAPLYGMDIQMNPEKKDNKYVFDLLYNGEPADLKTVRTPFFTAWKYRLNPSKTVTLNIKDIVRYKKYENFTIVFWVNWQAQTKYGTTVDPIDGVWCYTMDDLRSLLPLPTHSYQKRTNDTKGNAKDSVVIELRDDYAKIRT
jgi:hypothetical protein